MAQLAFSVARVSLPLQVQLAQRTCGVAASRNSLMSPDSIDVMSLYNGAYCESAARLRTAGSSPRSLW